MSLDKFRNILPTSAHIVPRLPPVTLRIRLLAPVTAALTGGLVLGLLTLAPAPATPQRRRDDPLEGRRHRGDASPATSGDQTRSQVRLRPQLLPLLRLPGLPRRRHGQRRLRLGERQDVLADVLRPQLHQLRRLPDGAQRTAQRAALVGRRQRDLLGHVGARRSPTTSRPSERWRGGRPTPVRPGRPATSRTSSGSSPTTRSSSPRTAGAATSPGRPSPAAAATGRAASSTSTTSRSSTRPRPVINGIAKVGAQLTATAGTWKPTDAKISYQWYADGKPIKKAHRRRPSRSARKRLGPGPDGHARPRPSSATRPSPRRPLATAAVLPGPRSATPSRPRLSGTPQVDSTLTVSTGTWDPDPDHDHDPVVRRRRADRRRHRADARPSAPTSSTG